MGLGSKQVLASEHAGGASVSGLQLIDVSSNSTLTHPQDSPEGLRAQVAYRGQLDASRPGNDLPCDGRDRRAAIAAVLAGEPVPGEQRPAIGCNSKWHAERGPVVRAT